MAVSSIRNVASTLRHSEVFAADRNHHRRQSSHMTPRILPPPSRVGTTSPRRASGSSVIDVIKSIRHKGLRKFHNTGNAAGIRADHCRRLRLQLSALESAITIRDMDIPGYRLHLLRGEVSGRWAISVSRNWRLTFRFESGDVHDLNYEDYH